MNKLKNTAVDHNIILEMCDELDQFSVLLEAGKYEGITVMMDHFGEHLKVNENRFAQDFNKLLGDLIAFSNNKNAIIEQLPAQFSFQEE